MKTRNAKFILVFMALAAGIAMSSFTLKKKPAVVKKETAALTKWEEYEKVRTYVQENICEPIRKNSKNPSAGLKSFSRCPSGYHPRIAGAADSVSTDKFVMGKVTLYKGCSGEYVCDFKVYVNKNIALVKNKETEDFVSVDDFLGKTKTLPVQQKSATEVKG